jgi:hypothetical protein
VLVFAHPWVLVEVPRSVGYYRMISMVSQKSMAHVKLVTGTFADCEEGKRALDSNQAMIIAQHLNGIVSNLISMDTIADSREFDLWHGMAAGTQAQGSWQNLKGQKAEAAVKGMLYLRMKEAGIITDEITVNPPLTMELHFRTVVGSSSLMIPIMLSTEMHSRLRC